MNLTVPTRCSASMVWRSNSTLQSHQLRLLRPLRIEHDHLSFEMACVPRSAAPPYTAISYTWGDANPDECIYLNGHRFPVRRNLWSCLHYISKLKGQSKNKWTHLWADAICINQADNEEKNSQVRQMDFTYRDASSVSVWLGLPLLPELMNDGIIGSIKTLDVSGFDWGENIQVLANHPYWKRSWVVQEFLLGQDVNIFCGNTICNWNDFKYLLDLYAHDVGDIRSETAIPSTSANESWAALPLITGRHTDRHPNFGQPLVRLLIDHCHSECKDPMDRVFSLLGLVPKEERFFLQRFLPDYDMNESDVMTIALSHIKHMNLDWDGNDSDRLYAGLGISSKSQLQKILEIVEFYDYFGDQPPNSELRIDFINKFEEDDVNMGVEACVSDDYTQSSLSLLKGFVSLFL